MDKHRICKICSRRFANGKAMGGHMRSHFAKLPIKSNNTNGNNSPKHPSPPSKYPSSSSSLSNMQTSYRSINREFYDLDGEVESSRNLRLKRPTTNVEPVTKSAFSSDGEVAMCLLTLSRDKWLRKEKQVVVVADDQDQDESESEDESCLVAESNSKKYKCKTCKRAFRSYQALGGHKASHKKIKLHHDYNNNNNNNNNGEAAAAAVVMEHHRTFECPFCDKVFDSGQALGGHKKIHYTYLTSAASPALPRRNSPKSLIDLNLPAPPEDDSE